MTARARLATSLATDVNIVRAETPGLQNVVHFNSAGAAPPTKQVLTAQQEFLELEADICGYEAKIKRSADLDRSYTAVAKLINCKPDEVAVVTSSTTAWFQVFASLNLQTGNVLLTSLVEYGSNYLADLQVPLPSLPKVQVDKLHSL